MQFLLTCTACSSPAEQSEEQNHAEREGLMPTGELRPGPVRHESLSREQIARITLLQETFAEVDARPLEAWIDNFKRDVNPDREIAVWERIAAAYVSFCEGRQLSQQAKKEVFAVLLFRSMGSEEETLDRVQLKVLSRDDALELMNTYR